MRVRVFEDLLHLLTPVRWAKCCKPKPIGSRTGGFCADRDKRIVRRAPPPASCGSLGRDDSWVPCSATPSQNDDLIFCAQRHATGGVAGRAHDMNAGNSRSSWCGCSWWSLRSRRTRRAFCALQACWPWYTCRARIPFFTLCPWLGLAASANGQAQENQHHRPRSHNCPLNPVGASTSHRRSFRAGQRCTRLCGGPLRGIEQFECD